MEVNEEVLEIRKILVKCPPQPEDAFSTFPFLIALSEEFPKAEINLLCEEKCSLAYNFLPFKQRAFERPKDKLSLVQTHHFCANFNDVFNIDLFIDLENTFNSSFMGFNFRARERVGFGIGWNKYFLTKSFVNIENVNLERKCIELLDLYTGTPHQDIKISRARGEGAQVEKIEKLFEEPEPPQFIMVMLDNFQNITKQISIWSKFFDSFQNQKFIIWSQNDEDLISELFSKIDLGGNSLFMHKGSNAKELIYLLNKVKGVVTNNLRSEGLCTYFGVDAVSLIPTPLKQLPEYHYFYFKPHRFTISEIGQIKYTYIKEERDMSEMNQIVDHIHFHFKL